MIKLEDVLLTDAEIDNEESKRHKAMCENVTDSEREDKWLCKAQCLKLLDVLKKKTDCTHLDHSLHSHRIMDCCKCFAELEKILKEG